MGITAHHTAHVVCKSKMHLERCKGGRGSGQLYYAFKLLKRNNVFYYVSASVKDTTPPLIKRTTDMDCTSIYMK